MPQLNAWELHEMQAPIIESVPAPVGPTPLVARVIARYNTGGGLDGDALATMRRRRTVFGHSQWKR